MDSLQRESRSTEISFGGYFPTRPTEYSSVGFLFCSKLLFQKSNKINEFCPEHRSFTKDFLQPTIDDHHMIIKLIGMHHLHIMAFFGLVFGIENIIHDHELIELDRYLFGACFLFGIIDDDIWQSGQQCLDLIILDQFKRSRIDQ